MESMSCQKCKSTENLIKNSVNSSDKIQWLCRKCNTERSRKYAQTNKGILARRNAVYRSLKKYQEKHLARVKVYYAVKTGELCNPNQCEDCLKKTEVFAHHIDYARPLEVVWLCRTCHVLIHKNT